MVRTSLSRTSDFTSLKLQLVQKIICMAHIWLILGFKASLHVIYRSFKSNCNCVFGPIGILNFSIGVYVHTDILYKDHSP